MICTMVTGEQMNIVCWKAIAAFVWCWNLNEWLCLLLFNNTVKDNTRKYNDNMNFCFNVTFYINRGNGSCSIDCFFLLAAVLDSAGMAQHE